MSGALNPFVHRHDAAAPCTPECTRRASTNAALGRSYDHLAAAGATVEGEWKQQGRELKTERRRAAVAAGEAFRLEIEEQRDVVNKLREANIGVASMNNGAHLAGDTAEERSAKWSSLVTQGAMEGAPDLIVMPGEGRTIYLEMKRVQAAYLKRGPAALRRAVSDKQRACHERLRARGYTVLVGWGAADALEQLRALGVRVA